MHYVESTLEDFIKQSYFGGAVGALTGALSSDSDKTLEGAIYGGLTGTAANAATMGIRPSYADTWRRIAANLKSKGEPSTRLKEELGQMAKNLKSRPKYVTPKVLLGVGGGLLAAHLLNDKGLLGGSDTAPPRPKPTPGASTPLGIKDRALEFYKDNETGINSLAALAALAAAGEVAYRGYQYRNTLKK